MAPELLKPIEILLVEDNPGDVRLTKEALSECLINHVYVVYDGEEALDFLHQRGRYEKMPRPGLILLDLNMPRMNGIEFLRELKQDAHLCRIPVVVLTTSREEQDRVESFKLSVAGYMIKPVDYLQFVEVIRTIQLYWTLSEAAP